MACINKALPAFKELSDYFGDSLASSIVRNNNMDVPNLDQAINMVKADKVLQFKKALNHLRSTTSSSITDLLNAFPRILQRKGNDIYVLKGSRLSEVPKAGAKAHIEEANVSFLRKVNEAFGPLFTISQNYNFTRNQIAEAQQFAKELVNDNLVSSVYHQSIQTDPIEFFKFVAQQSQNVSAEGVTNGELDSTKATVDTFGQAVVDFANELFPSKNKNPFTDSKVQEVVYHGTNNVFDEFSKEKLGSKNWMAESAATGFFFAGSPETSKAYIGMNSADVMGMSLGSNPILVDVENMFKEEQNSLDEKVNKIKEEEKVAARDRFMKGDVMKALQSANLSEKQISSFQTQFEGIDLQNSIDARLESEGVTQALQDLGKRRYNEIEKRWIAKKGLNPRIMKLYLDLKNPYVFDYAGKGTEAEGLTSHIKKAKEAGNDGVIFKNLADGGEQTDSIYVAFEPSQIAYVEDNGVRLPKILRAGKSLFTEPNAETAAISDQYKQDKGIDTPAGEKIYALDQAYSMKIADAFELMQHNPADPIVKEAYEAMASETVDQFNAIIKAGYNVEVYQGEGEPYANSQAMIDDVRTNKHLYILATDNAFGSDSDNTSTSNENPLLADSGRKDINGRVLLVNDAFRFVHDFFGHSERGNGFGAVGEENAWDTHARMYSPIARRAMTTETRGQNSWVNFGPQMRNEDGSIKTKNDIGYLSPTEREFAPQKIGLMPDEFSTLAEDLGIDRPGQKIAEGTYKVNVDETILSNIAQENQESPKEDPYTDNTTTEQYQKSAGIDFDEEAIQRKRYAINHLVRILSTRFNIPFEYDTTMSVAGKFSNGKIVLNPNLIGADTAFHEIAHPFINMIKSENPELYKNLIDELRNTEAGQAEMARVASEYSELSPEDQLDEALVSLIGKEASDNYDWDKKPSLFQQFWNWVKQKLFGMGLDATNFNPRMKISEVAEMITNPMISIDLARNQRQDDLYEAYQKKSGSQIQREFNSLIDDTIAKLSADASIYGRNEEERSRKSASRRQAENLKADRKDINAINSFITSGLFNLKGLNERFDEFIDIYDNKKNKTKEDVRKLAELLNQIEDNLTIYSNVGPLMESVFDMFPAEKDNLADWQYSLKREKRLLTDYKMWGTNVVADWLYPYAEKAVRQAVASNKRSTVVSDEVYNAEKLTAEAEGITDQNEILKRAVKQEIRNTLAIAKGDASAITGYLAGVLNSRDSISALVGQSLMDELHKALTLGKTVNDKFQKLMKQYRGSALFDNNEDEKKFYQKYLRKAKVWSYLGLGEDGKAKYEYREHSAFHEEYEWDTFNNNKRESFIKILQPFDGKIPSKNDKVKYQSYKAQRDAWFAANTITTIDAKGKESVIPAAKYKNAQFGALMNDPLFKELYTTYKMSNDKLGHQGLKYGIVPQEKNKGLEVKDLNIPGKVSNSIKNPKNILEGLRQFVGEQEQVYFVQSIAGGEKPVIPISFVRLLEDKDLSYNLIDSVSKFTTSSAKYSSMQMIEPQVQILKNFIGGNNALDIKKRRTLHKSASGIKSLAKGIHNEMYVDSTRLNAQLNSFLNDVVYGQSMKKEVTKMWDAKFEVTKEGDTSVNGGPKVEKIHGFENVREFTGFSELDYSGFEFGKPRKVGDYNIRMVQKDWNFSVKKAADRLGLATALSSMSINVLSSAANLLRGKIESFTEGLGGKYYNVKEWLSSEKDYWKSLPSLMEDLKGGKPSFLSSIITRYDAIQGEMQDIQGKKIERGVANRLFKTRHLFFLQNGGEHSIQSQLLMAMMKHQKVTLNTGESLSLYEARQREFNGQLDFKNVSNWSETTDDEFRRSVAEVNTRLNGNYNKADKAMLQRTWWGSMLMMFRKHIYNTLANRYRKGYVDYQTGNYTEGYWRSFSNGLVREIGSMARDMQIRWPVLTETEKYSAKKTIGDIAIFVLLLTSFKMFDDDDEDDEFNDTMALLSRRLISESTQYLPVVAPLEFGKMVTNPTASTRTVVNMYDALKQTLSDPSDEYDRSGSGYDIGDNKAWTKWQRVIPAWRGVINAQQPERLLKFYQTNSLGFLKPETGAEDDDAK